MGTSKAAGAAAPAPAFAYPSAHSSNPAYLGPRSSTPGDSAPSSDLDPLALRRLVLPALRVEGEDEVEDMDGDEHQELEDEDGFDDEDENEDGEGDVTIKQEEGEDYTFVRPASCVTASMRVSMRVSMPPDDGSLNLPFPRIRATRTSPNLNQIRNPRRSLRMRWTTDRRGSGSSSAKR